MTHHLTMRRLLASAAFAVALPFATMAEAKDLTIGLTSDPTILDPQAGEELSSNIMFYHIYDPLVRRDSSLSFCLPRLRAELRTALSSCEYSVVLLIPSPQP